MLLTIEEYKQYIPTTTVDAPYLSKHETRAMLKHLPKYLGVPLTKELLSNTPSTVINSLISQLKGAIANMAFLEAVPFIDLVSTKTGFGIVSNQNLAPASAQRVDNFKNACLGAINDYLSDTLLFIETYSDDYPEWNKSSLIEGGLIENIDEWPSSDIDIGYSRTRFVDLIPFIRQAERLIITKKLSPEFVSAIAGTTDVIILPDIKKALAFFAMHLMNPDTPKYIKPAEEYLTSVLDYLKNHLDDYPLYRDNGYEVPFANDLDTYGFIKM